ncbi:GT2 family glycosyltransferase [Paenibacillus sp. JGP012]|uniref:glycosyltransferase family 2 protein n=1 Tax=Paenibacillus sp. JGP012 TaxID=2735914 RepID=UPI0017A04D72|nr:glycosyltransferase family 2 protein [Paenibacillus sp. JGP012]MBB6024670.1 GT2 family glycosyltransferase [Paenibacillus sp. JGP012]
MKIIEIDIIIVTFNSQDWIIGCLDSIKESLYPQRKIYITVVDNKSTDHTRDHLEDYFKNYEKEFGGISLIYLDENKGFGAANNIGVEGAKTDFCLLLNADAELTPNALARLMEVVSKSNEDVAMWELKQKPFEHPKIYDPLTREVSWCSGASCLIKRDVFLSVGGFDESIFMYAEDVDLSWRIRKEGYKLHYIPECEVFHDTMIGNNPEKQSFKKYHSIVNNLLLRAKFGNWFVYITGVIFYVLYTMTHLKTELGKKLFFHFPQQFVKGLKYHRVTRATFEPKFYQFDYEISKGDENYKIQEGPYGNNVISIIIRSIGRENYLKECLKSLENQTYKNIELVIIEDGSNKLQEKLSTLSKSLKVIYHSTGLKVGRAKAGNIGLGLATGKYMNFLDEDDILLNDHCEVLIQELSLCPDYKVAYSLSIEAPLKEGSFSEQFTAMKDFFSVNFNEQHEIKRLFQDNYLPIQTVMFSREMFLNFGGFDESLDALEDWDLWMKYALETHFLYVGKVTSIYRVPFDVLEYASRQMVLSNNRKIIIDKYKNHTLLNVDNIKKRHKKRYLLQNVWCKFKKSHQYNIKLFILKLKRRICFQSLKIVNKGG